MPHLQYLLKRISNLDQSRETIGQDGMGDSMARTYGGKFDNLDLQPES